MKKSFIVLLHIGFWACYFLLILIVLNIYSRTTHKVGDSATRTLNAFYSILLFVFIPSVISYFLYYFILFPKFLHQQKHSLSIIYGVLISAGPAILGYCLQRYLIESGRIMDMDQGGINGRSTVVRVISLMTTIDSICGMVALVIKRFITWFNEIKLKEGLKAKNHEMEMALIKSQLDPHFLFNTIKNIDALILKNTIA